MLTGVPEVFVQMAGFQPRMDAIGYEKLSTSGKVKGLP